MKERLLKKTTSFNFSKIDDSIKKMNNRLENFNIYLVEIEQQLKMYEEERYVVRIK